MASHLGSTGLCPDEVEECEAVSIMQGEKASTTHYGSLNLQSPFKPTSSKAVDDSLKLDLLGDQDSGFPSSTSLKASLKNSISCSESNDDGDESEDERPGCFDYTQLTQKARTAEHIRIRPTLNPEYDEDVKIDSSTGGSSIESPRSETSVTHEEYSLADDVEMQVFSHSSQEHPRSEEGQSEFARITSVNEHQHLYGMHNRSHDDVYEFDSWQKPQQQGLRDRHQASLEPKKAEVLRNSYNCSQDPAFGGSTGAIGQQKPQGRISKRTRVLSKDATSEQQQGTPSGGLDVNGNPPVDISNYQQMRQSMSAAGKVVDGGSFFPTLPPHSSNALTSTSQTTSPSPIGGLEHSTDLEKKRQRKLKKQEKEKCQLSENVTNFKGHQSIDELLSFIEGENNHKKRGAGSSSSSSSTAPSSNPVGGKVDKQKKKQEKNKKELVNGQEEKTTGESVQPASAPPMTEVTSSPLLSPSMTVVTSSPVSVMGNTTTGGQAAGHEDSMTSTASTASTATATSPYCGKENCSVEEHDHSGEFYDCVNSSPGERNYSPEKDVKVDSLASPIRTMAEETPSKVVVDSVNVKDAKEDTVVVAPVKNSKLDNKKNTLSLKVNGKKQKEQDVIIENHDSVPKVPNSLLTKQIAEIDSRALVFNSLRKDSDELVEETIAQTSFIEVKKKKKRNVSKETGNVSNVENSHPNHSFFAKGSHTGNNVYKKYRPQRAVPTSSTSAVSASSTVSSNVVGTNNPSLVIKRTKDDLSFDKYTRDLSPSSFPVLMCHTNTTSSNTNRPPERRNSCGDINDIKTDAASETRSVCCDSDRESVKSLPAAPNVRAAGESSPLFPVSYATMVAVAQHQQGDSSHSPSSESGVICGSQNSSINSYHPHSSLELVSPPLPTNNARDGTTGSTPERKPTVWKGSPRERRHSIGSSPDDKPEAEKSCISSRNRQKSGSQECLALMLTSSHPGSGGETKESAPTDHTNSGQAPTSCDGCESKGDHPPPMGVTQGKPSNATTINKGSNTKNNVRSAPNPCSTVQNPLISGRNHQGKTTSVSVSKMPGPDTRQGSLETASKKGNGNTRPVTFLDNRFGSKSIDLGITFGFDSSMEPLVDNSTSSKAMDHPLAQKPLACLPSSSIATVAHTSSSTASSSSSLQQQRQVAATAVQSSQALIPNIPVIATKTSASSDRNQTQSSDNNHQLVLSSNNSPLEKTLKGPPRKNGPSNGLVLPPNLSLLQAATGKPEGSVASATTTTSSRRSKSVVNQTDNNGSPSQGSGNEPSCPSNSGSGSTTISGGKTKASSSHPNNASSSNPHPQQQPPSSTLSQSTSDQRPLKGGKMVPHALHHNQQPQPLDRKGTKLLPGPHPVNLPPSNNNPLVLPTAFIGQTGVPLFSPHYPPPPLPLPAIVDPLSLQPSTNPTGISANPKPEIPFVSGSSSLPSSSPSPNKPSSSQQPRAVTAESDNAPSFDNPIKVIYGLNIKPEGGCGALFFKPAPLSSKKQKKNSYTDMAGFLKKKWTEVKAMQKKDTESYIFVCEQ